MSLRNGDLNGVEADLVGWRHARLPVQATARHPDGEAEDMMIAPIGILRTRTAADSVANTTSVSSSIPRVSRSSKQPGDRLIDPTGTNVA